MFIKAYSESLDEAMSHPDFMCAMEVDIDSKRFVNYKINAQSSISKKGFLILTCRKLTQRHIFCDIDIILNKKFIDVSTPQSSIPYFGDVIKGICLQWQREKSINSILT